MWFVFCLKKRDLAYYFEEVATTICCVIILVPCSLYGMRSCLDGTVFLLVPMVLIALNDTWAYVCGVTFGKHPLISISASKTWEGYIGGGILTVLSAPVVAWAMLWIMDTFPGIAPTSDWMWFITQESPSVLPCLSFLGAWTPFHWFCFWIAVFAATAGPFSGFIASGLKRVHGIKDYSNAIP
ncbi:hypothetical protein KIPB_011159, partial [Kipferlia bialata]|eukprot:g11159.t1